MAYIEKRQRERQREKKEKERGRSAKTESAGIHNVLDSVM